MPTPHEMTVLRALKKQRAVPLVQTAVPGGSPAVASGAQHKVLHLPSRTVFVLDIEACVELSALTLAALGDHHGPQDGDQSNVIVVPRCVIEWMDDRMKQLRLSLRPEDIGEPTLPRAAARVVQREIHSLRDAVEKLINASRQADRIRLVLARSSDMCPSPNRGQVIDTALYFKALYPTHELMIVTKTSEIAEVAAINGLKCNATFEEILLRPFQPQATAASLPSGAPVVAETNVQPEMITDILEDVRGDGALDYFDDIEPNPDVLMTIPEGNVLRPVIVDD